MLGEGVRSVNVMLPGMIGYDETTPVYTYDPAKCTETLQQSKWTQNADGTWTPDPAGAVSLWDTGFRLTMGFNTGNTQRQTIGEILQNSLVQVNPKFVVEVTALPWPTFLSTHRARKLPMFTIGWIMDLYETHNWVVPYTTGTYGVRQGLPKEIMAQYSAINSKAVVEVDPKTREVVGTNLFNDVNGFVRYRSTDAKARSASERAASGCDARAGSTGSRS